jgi:PIN domain nuclease of toxin-antitoxin system
VKLLLDTHALAWWFERDGRLSAHASVVIADPASSVYVSVATAWEIAIKVGLGKWPEAVPLLSQFEIELSREGFVLLPIDVRDVRAAGLIQSPHRDPFDRLLAAQAICHGMTLVSNDRKMAALGAQIIW